MRQKPTSQEIKEIAALIARLMSHYWTAADPVQTRQAQLEDWLDDLVEFGPAAVAEACREWRRTQSRRPTPADIRRLAAEARAVDQRCLPPPVERWTDEDFQRAADDWAREHGFADWASMAARSYSVVIRAPDGSHRYFGPARTASAA